jgi:hypothetical protein
VSSLNIFIVPIGEGPPPKRKKGKGASTAANRTCPVPARSEGPFTKRKKGNSTTNLNPKDNAVIAAKLATQKLFMEKLHALIYCNNKNHFCITPHDAL